MYFLEVAKSLKCTCTGLHCHYYLWLCQFHLRLVHKHDHYLKTFLCNVGKTAAYMLPILERLIYRPQQTSVTRVLILTPTRELAIQVLHQYSDRK